MVIDKEPNCKITRRRLEIAHWAAVNGHLSFPVGRIDVLYRYHKVTHVLFLAANFQHLCLRRPGEYPSHHRLLLILQLLNLHLEPDDNTKLPPPAPRNARNSLFWSNFGLLLSLSVTSSPSAVTLVASSKELHPIPKLLVKGGGHPPE